MAQLIKPIEIDCSRPNRFQTTVSKQGDINSRFLRVSLADNGNPIEITSENTVIVNYKRGDGKINSFSGTVNEDGTVTIPLTSWLLDVSGNADCEIVIYDSTEQSRLSTTLFTLYVEPFITDDSEVTEDSKYDILLTLITQVDTAVNACNTATEAAQQATTATEKAITDAEDATEATNAAIEAATTATENANAATERANEAAEVIENIKAEDIPFDPTITEKTSLHNVQEALDSIILNQGMNSGDNISIKDWSDVQKLVRAGLAPSVFSIGDQITCAYGDGTITFDVIGFDIDTPADPQYQHSMTLQAHDILLNMPFNSPEALFANHTENDIPAGTYHFTLDGVTYQFTLTNDIPAQEEGYGSGGIIMINGSLNTAPTTAALYPDSITEEATESVPITVGSEGTDLATLGNVNTDKRRLYYGSCRYKHSEIRSFLISGEDYCSELTLSPFAKASSKFLELAPFLYDLDKDLVAVLGAVNKKVYLNEVDGGGMEILADKAFLVSSVEVYGEDDDSGDVCYPYYRIFSSNDAPSDNRDTNRRKYIAGQSSAKYWWLRNPYNPNDPSYSNYVRNVHYYGIINYNSASNENGVAPACCIV